MSTEESSVLRYLGSACTCLDEHRPACSGLPAYRMPDGRWYCILHYPSTDKGVDFENILKQKLDAKDFNFSGVFFPSDVRFIELDDVKNADFNSAVFNGSVDFSFSSFKNYVDFGGAKFFETVNFEFCEFRDGVNFSCVTFVSDITIANSTFTSIDFNHATFHSSYTFQSTNYKTIHQTILKFESLEEIDGVLQDGLSFDFARFEKPKNATFHHVDLAPRWFVNVDTRLFNFSSVNWIQDSIKSDIRQIISRGSHYSILSMTYRNLAINAEENHDYRIAQIFRYQSMDAQRLKKWNGWAFYRMEWWYWILSGYGERAWKAALVLAILVFGFAFWYSEVDFVIPETLGIAKTKDPDSLLKVDLDFSESLLYSVVVMTLQKPDPKPLTIDAKIPIYLESILGPVQAALLALAIRRKFMR